MAGPLLGTGYLPGGSQGNELEAVTRRAFIPKCVVQIGQHSPVLAAGLANAQTASGGLSSVEVPVQGTAMTTAQMTDYSGQFTAPGNQVGISEAAFNLKALVVPVGFLGMEGLVQYNAAVIPLLAARMNDAGNQAASLLATDLATNATDATTSINGFPLCAATTGTFGNINRSTAGNEWWQGKVIDPGAGANNTRATWLNYIISATKNNGGECPNIAVMGPATWAQLASNFVGQEQYQITPGRSFAKEAQGPGAAFTALMVAGVPIYMDINFPEGIAFLWHTRYASFYIHELAAFAFTGFASTIPTFSLGYVGVLVAALEWICVKPKSFVQIGSATTNLLASVGGGVI